MIVPKAAAGCGTRTSAELWRPTSRLASRGIPDLLRPAHSTMTAPSAWNGVTRLGTRAQGLRPRPGSHAGISASVRFTMKAYRPFGSASCLCFGSLVVLVMAAPVGESLDSEADSTVIARHGGHVRESISTRYDPPGLHNHCQPSGPLRLPYDAPS